MKKIITAAAIAAMVTSFAAAEVTVGLNNRVRPDLYKIVGKDGGDNGDDTTETTYADLEGFDKTKDVLTVKGSTDYAGVAAEIELFNPSNANTEAGKLSIDNYYGWVNWGAFKVTAGTYDSRYTNRGNYTATEQGILDQEFSKTMGLSTKNGILAGLGKDADGNKYSDYHELNWLGDFGNVAQINGGNKLSFLADYTFNNVADGALLLKGGFIQNDGGDDYDSYKKDDGDKFSQKAGYVFEAAWRKEKTVAVDFIFKNPYNKAYGFGLYVTPLMIPNTKNVVIGFTYGTREDWIKSAFAIDFRGQYNITDAAIVALGAKYESLKIDEDGADTESALQIAGEFSYKVNDIFTAAFDLGYFNEDLDDNDDVKNDGTQFLVTSLRGLFTAGKGATVTTALRLNKVLNVSDAGGTSYTFDIPVVLRVKM